MCKYCEAGPYWEYEGYQYRTVGPYSYGPQYRQELFSIFPPYRYVSNSPDDHKKALAYIAQKRKLSEKEIVVKRRPLEYESICEDA